MDARAAMHPFSTRTRLILAIGVILSVGFLALNFVNYQTSRQSVRDALMRSELPLTSNNIYSEIQTGLLQPIYVSSLMAHDTFLKDWILGGEQPEAAIQRYLTEISEQYDVFSVFLVSDLTRRYYHFSGVLKAVDPGTPKDQWFFTMADHPSNFRIDVDHNEAADFDLTLFINHKVFDDTGRFIGVTGVGLNMSGISALIADYMQTYGRNIYLVARDGTIRSHADPGIVGQVNIRERPGLGSVAAELLSNTEGSLQYARDDDTVLLTYRFIPELDWYLLVEQSEGGALAPIRRAYYANQATSLGIIAVVLLITAFTVDRFQRQLEALARFDKLTGAYNRQYFDLLASHALKRARRDGRPVALLVFDVDHFKPLNDTHGHAVGDRVLAEVVACARRALRESDLIGRWGGDEFVVMMPACSATSAAEVADKLRRAVTGLTETGDTPPVTISVGVAEWRLGEDLEALVARADTQLYAAKRQGRDRTVGENAADSPAEEV